MKKIMLVLSLLFSLQSQAAENNLDLCETISSIKVLYSGKPDYSGINKDIIYKAKAISSQNNKQKSNEIELMKNFDISSKNGNLLITSNNLSFSECNSIRNSCSEYKDIPKLHISSFCTPIASKINVTVEK